MVEIDEVWDRIKKTPEAGDVVQLIEHYREAARLPETEKRGTKFRAVFSDAETAGRELEGALRSGTDEARKAAVDRSAGLCASCHREFRDRP